MKTNQEPPVYEKGFIQKVLREKFSGFIVPANERVLPNGEPNQLFFHGSNFKTYKVGMALPNIGTVVRFVRLPSTDPERKDRATLIEVIDESLE